MTTLPHRSTTQRRISKAVISLVVLTFVFVISVAITDPFGNFPLNDDWSFGTTTRNFFATGTWEPTSYPSMPLITNALWAMPVCGLTACSFDDLRLATLLAAILLLVATFVLVRKGGGRAVALVAAAVMVFNPISYALSFTFMTDVLFWALVIVSASAFVVSLERNSARWAAIGAVVALAATLSRQLALAVPLAFCVVRLLQPGPWRRRLVVALLPILICGAALAAFNHWLVAAGKVPAQLTVQSEGIAQSFRNPPLLLKRLVENLTTALLYMGWLSLPVLLMARRRVPSGANPRLQVASRAIAVAAVLLIVAAMVVAQRIMPFGKNILVPEGVGPLTLRDAFVLAIPNVPRLPAAWWALVTALGVAGSYGMIERLALFLLAEGELMLKGAPAPRSAAELFAVAAVLAYTLPLLVLSAYDRYFVAFLPLVFFVIAATADPGPVQPLRSGAAIATVLMMAGFAVAASHDYMAWNRARWAAINDLQAAHTATPATLDGGIEYNGLTSYDPSYIPSPGKSFWWVKDDDYVIAFGPVPGRRVVRSYPYRTFLSPSERSIVVLGREADQSRASAP